MGRSSHRSGNDRGLITVALARFSAIGDVAMTVPVVYSLCRTYPDISFIFVTRRTMADIFVNPPANLKIIGVDLKTDYVGVKGMYRLAKELRQDYDMDLFIDLHNVLRTRMLRLFWRLSGIKSKVIRKGKARKKALTRRYRKRLLPLISQRARYREACFRAGLPVNDNFNGLYDGRAKSDPSVFAAITAPKRPGEKWIGVAPFAAHKGKIYPVEQMAHALELTKSCDHDVRFFFFGGGGEEQKTLESWAEKFPGSVSLAGKKYGFAVELALINHLDTMITMDSANMHLASIASVPTISIWGATHPYCGFKGWRQHDADIVQLPMTCRPCSVFGSKACHRGDYLCLTAIDPAAIAQRAVEKLS
ncbi:MAG: glycosyltransferase family 9 protein [Muribaculaceae bacterium]|nr:glycosyltransferase family 9 protein [Muribaculaceae bacterium]